MIPRHKNNPPEEVMSRQMRVNRKDYYESIEERVAKAVKQEIGVDPLHNIKYRAGMFPVARQIFLVMLKRKKPELSLQKIADNIRTSHDYVLYSERHVNNLCDTDKRLKAQFLRIEAKLNLNR
jgi:hypothetical protein